MEFKCSICDYTSELKIHVKRHINNKTKCGEGNPEIIEVPMVINCEFCEKSFKTAPSMKRHLKTCKVKKANLEEELAQKDEENRILKEKLNEALTRKPTTIIHNNNNNTNTVNNNIIIQITPYNDPNLEGAERYYKEAIKKIFMSVPTIIERIHFNTELPENHNICITNYRTKLAKVFNGREWKTMDEDRLIDELVNTYENLLEDWAEDNPERMKHIERYKEIKERDGAEKVLKDLKDEVKKLIYDKRAMIKGVNKLPQIKS
jgi:hypothetical protein